MRLQILYEETCFLVTVLFVTVLLLSPVQLVQAGFWSWTRLTGATDSNPALHSLVESGVRCCQGD